MRKILVLLAFYSVSLVAQASDHPANAKAGGTGWEAYSALQSGNMRFYEGAAKHPKQDSHYRESLSAGQHPHTIIVSCSDSRVPPETIFDQGLGEIFTIRLAGHVLNPDAIASIEYAVDHLHPKLLVVMGHEACGAVTAAIKTKPGTSAGSPSLDELVGKIRPNVEASARELSPEEKLYRAPVKANVTATLRELLQRSAIVREAVEKEELVIGQAIYNLKSGRAEFWDMGKLPAGAPGDVSKLAEQVVHSEEIKPAVAPVKKKLKVKTPSQVSPADHHSLH